MKYFTPKWCKMLMLFFLFNWTLCIAYFVLNVKRLSWCFSRVWIAYWAQNQFTDIHKNAHTISLKNSITFLIWPRHSIHLQYHQFICTMKFVINYEAQMNENRPFVCLFVISALIKIWTCARKQVICDSFGSGMVSVHWNHWTTATYGLKVWYLAHSFHFNGEYIFDLKTFPLAFFFCIDSLWAEMDETFCHSMWQL